MISRGDGTVLLVEDTAAVRRFNEEVLLQAGYRIYPAADGKEALQLAQAHAAGIDLLITDVRFPGGDGFQLAERVAALAPRCKFLFVSGSNDGAPESLMSALPAWDYLAKPYTPADLCDRVRRLLGSAKPCTRVLVVDDEKPIRRFFQEVLEQAGYGVITAENGREATLRLSEDAGIDFVLTDLVMPEMEGIEFISAVRRSRPDVTIVATSGGDRKEYLQGAAALGAAATLAKPVAPETLLDCLRNLPQY